MLSGYRSLLQPQQVAILESLVTCRTQSSPQPLPAGYPGFQARPNLAYDPPFLVEKRQNRASLVQTVWRGYLLRLGTEQTGAFSAQKTVSLLTLLFLR